MIYARIADKTVAEEYFSVTEKVEALYDQRRRLPANDEGSEMRKLRGEMHRRMLGNGYCARPVEFRPTLQAQRDDADRKGQVARKKSSTASSTASTPRPHGTALDKITCISSTIAGPLGVGPPAEYEAEAAYYAQHNVRVAPRAGSRQDHRDGSPDTTRSTCRPPDIRRAVTRGRGWGHQATIDEPTWSKHWPNAGKDISQCLTEISCSLPRNRSITVPGLSDMTTRSCPIRGGVQRVDRATQIRAARAIGLLKTTVVNIASTRMMWAPHASVGQVLWITNSSGRPSDCWGGKYVLMTVCCCSAIPDRGAAAKAESLAPTQRSTDAAFHNGSQGSMTRHRLWRHPMSRSISVDHAMVPGIANRVCLNSRGEATRPPFAPPRDLFPR